MNLIELMCTSPWNMEHLLLVFVHICLLFFSFYFWFLEIFSYIFVFEQFFSYIFVFVFFYTLLATNELTFDCYDTFTIQKQDSQRTGKNVCLKKMFKMIKKLFVFSK